MSARSLSPSLSLSLSVFSLPLPLPLPLSPSLPLSHATPSRQSSRQLQFNWYPSPNNFPERSLPTHVLDDSYKDLTRCYDNYIQCSNSTVFDWEYSPTVSPPVTPNNIDQRASDFVNMTLQRASYYRGSSVLLPFGHDFAFQNATAQFSNMDQIIAYVNERSDIFNVTLRYATLSDFFQTGGYPNPPPLNMTSGSDFLPYATCYGSDMSHHNGECLSYWSGFYSSYPILKEASRSSTSLLQVAEQILMMTSSNRGMLWSQSNREYRVIDSLERERSVAEGEEGRERGKKGERSGSGVNWAQMYRQILSLQNATAILQHHDAITGTCLDPVRLDYLNMIQSGKQYTAQTISDLLSLFYTTPNSNILADVVVTSGDAIDQTIAADTYLPLLLWNSLGWERHETVHFSLTQVCNHWRMRLKEGMCVCVCVCVCVRERESE